MIAARYSQANLFDSSGLALPVEHRTLNGACQFSLITEPFILPQSPVLTLVEGWLTEISHGEIYCMSEFTIWLRKMVTVQKTYLKTMKHVHVPTLGQIIHYDLKKVNDDILPSLASA